jgi:thioredoxin-dependent peroxiredoxin
MQEINELKPGMPAPDFYGIDQDGKQHKLADFKGKKLIIFFYPKANTSGCTEEACSLRDSNEILKEKGFAILGISADKVEVQKKFRDKYEFPFPLIADPSKDIIKAYGAWGPKKFMGKSFEGILRYTFVINEIGVIEKVFTKVQTANHAEQILTEYKF